MTTHAESSPRRRWFSNSFEAKEARLAWLLILPTALIVFGLVLFPAAFSVWISFRDVGLNNLNDVFNAPFTGLENYKNVINDFAFKYHSLQNWGAAITTVIYSFVSTALTIVVGLAAAIVLNQPFKARGIARGIFLIPYVAPVVGVAFVWSWLLDPRPSGVLNHILMSLGLIELPKAYLATRGLALGLVVLFQAWRYFPFAMLMLLARLQAVTLPELRYVLGSIFLLRLMWTFNKFDDIFLLTGGGFGTKVLPVLTYEFSFRLFDFGKGAASSMILMIILVIFMVFYVRIVMRGTEE